jgi:hypothetical protein
MGVIAQEGNMCRLDVEYFLEEILVCASIYIQFFAHCKLTFDCLWHQLPYMNPFPGRNSVLVMDNTKVHHGGNVQRLCNARGVLLIYFPPYSPDMNPIEKVFSVMKSQLKRRNILTGTSKDPSIIKQLLPHIVTPQLMANLF